MMNPNIVQINFAQQTGAVLLMALMLLVVLTLLGMSAIESTKLETKMAANIKTHTMAFQNAETGIAKTFQKYEQPGELEQLNQLLKEEKKCFKKVFASGQYEVKVLVGGNRTDPKQSRDLLVYFIESTGTMSKTDIRLYAGMTIDIPKNPDLLSTTGDGSEEKIIEEVPCK